ncbi:MAG: hypothetical protein U0X91_09690 [Spirosomataceae bacterium]
MVPPKTEYTITERGIRTVEVVIVIRNYGLELMNEMGINEK